MAQELSRGMRQKVAICCAYLHDPRVILFDEPLTGLDPYAIRTLKASIAERAKAGAAIMVSSHLLSLVEDLCTHLLILNKGRCLFVGTLDQARTQYADLQGDASLEEVFFRATEQARSGVNPRDSARDRHEPRPLHPADPEQQGDVSPDAPRRQDGPRGPAAAIHAGIPRPDDRPAGVHGDDDARPPRVAAIRRSVRAVRTAGALRLHPAVRLHFGGRGGGLLHPGRGRSPVRGSVHSPRAARLQAGEDGAGPALHVGLLFCDDAHPVPLLGRGVRGDGARAGDVAARRHDHGARRPDRRGVGLHPDAQGGAVRGGARDDGGPGPGGRTGRGAGPGRDPGGRARVARVPGGPGTVHGFHPRHLRRGLVPRPRLLGRGGAGDRRGPAHRRARSSTRITSSRPRRSARRSTSGSAGASRAAASRCR